MRLAKSMYPLDKIRNIGIAAHIDAGKTTLTERVLFYAGVIHRMGEVHDGEATMDYLPEERERGITITAAVTHFDWKGYLIQLIDTPGHVDFTIEVERALRVLDGLVLVLCGVGGVEPQTETIWSQAERYRIPRVIFINKLDRLGSSFERAFKDVEEKLGGVPVPVTVPVASEVPDIQVLDLIEGRKIVWKDEEGREMEFASPSVDELEIISRWRDVLFERLSEHSDEVMELYLEGKEIPPGLVRKVMRELTLSLKVVPVFSGSALKNRGVQPLMDGVLDFLPSPADLDTVRGMDPKTGEELVRGCTPDDPTSLFVFKIAMERGRKIAYARVYSGGFKVGEELYNVRTKKKERVSRIFRLHAEKRKRIEEARAGDVVALMGLKDAFTGDTYTDPSHPIVYEKIREMRPVIQVAVEPKSAKDEERLIEALARFCEEDPTLSMKRDEETGQIILSGMGELQLDIVSERLRREENLDVRVGKPFVVLRETVSKEAHGTGHIRQEMDNEVFEAEVELIVKPLKRGEGVSVVFSEGVKKNQAVEDAILSSLTGGVLEGYPVVDVEVEVLAFRSTSGEKGESLLGIAAQSAVRKALEDAKPVLLEPLAELTVTAPDEYMSDVIGDIGSRGGVVKDVKKEERMSVVKAIVPIRNMFGYMTKLRSITQGRGSYSMFFHSFDVMPR